jgi:hypothetical protein
MAMYLLRCCSVPPGRERRVEYGRGILLKVNTAARALDLDDIDYTLPLDLQQQEEQDAEEQAKQQAEECEEGDKVDEGGAADGQENDLIAAGGGGEEGSTSHTGGGGSGGSSAVAMAEQAVEHEVAEDMDVAIMTAREEALWQELAEEKARTEALEVQVASLEQRIQEYEKLILYLVASLAAVAVRSQLTCPPALLSCPFLPPQAVVLQRRDYQWLHITWNDALDVPLLVYCDA